MSPTWGRLDLLAVIGLWYDLLNLRLLALRSILTVFKVVARYFMGYYPSKFTCLLNIIIMLGYGMIDCLVGGQVLSAVAGGRMTVVVGIIIIALVTWLVVLFGMRLFHIYER